MSPVTFTRALTGMCQLVLLSAALLLVTNTARAASLLKSQTPGLYIMAMSKNDALCRSMLELYNNDMALTGRINYSSHKVFSNVHWESIDQTDQKADFDINNDGKNEIVIKFSGPIQAHYLDILFIYPEGSKIFTTTNHGESKWKLLDTPNMLFETYHSIFYLKNVPKMLRDKVLAYKLKHLPSYLNHVNPQVLQKDFERPYIAGGFVLQPFIWDGTYFISITNRNPEWIVIAKYKQAKEVQDMCYFYDQSHRFVNY